MKKIWEITKEFFRQFFAVLFSCLLTFFIALVFFPVFYAAELFENLLSLNYVVDSLFVTFIYGIAFILPLSFGVSILILLLKKLFNCKNIAISVGPFILIMILLYFFSSFLYSKIYTEIYSNQQDVVLYKTQWQSKESQQREASKICNAEKFNLNQNFNSLEDKELFVNDLVEIWGLKFKGKHPQKNGYITYYFKPNDSQKDLKKIKEILSREFENHGIGTSFHWLDADWYNEWLKENNQNVPNLIEVEDPFVRVRFETTYPTFDKFLAGKIYSEPPEHVLVAARAAHMVFVKTEPLQQMNHVYSKELGLKSFNINFSFWNVLDMQGKIKRTKLEKTKCEFSEGWFMRTFIIDFYP